MIPYGRQQIDAADIAAVVDTLQSDFLTQGPKVPAFEQAVAHRCQARFAVAMNSATSALHLACLALGVGPGDRVWTSPISFVASANCALYCGADIDFVDVDPGTGLMAPAALALKLQQAALNGTLPKVLIPVHLAGHSCDMQQIAALCQPYQIRIIEDASHAIGASYQNHPVGSCQYSDITVFSFHPVKIITSAEGGMALCNDPALDRQLRSLRSHGITRDEADMTEPSHGPWYYQQTALGFNYRMTDLQAALGLSQLDRLPQFIHQRIQATEYYQQLLRGLPLHLPAPAFDGESAWHLYIVRLQQPAGRLQVFQQLRAAGIGVNVHYIPIHTYSQIISLPLFAGISAAQQQQVADALRQALHGN